MWEMLAATRCQCPIATTPTASDSDAWALAERVADQAVSLSTGHLDVTLAAFGQQIADLVRAQTALQQTIEAEAAQLNATLDKLHERLGLVLEQVDKIVADEARAYLKGHHDRSLEDSSQGDELGA
jgi:hypothetical protein